MPGLGLGIGLGLTTSAGRDFLPPVPLAGNIQLWLMPESLTGAEGTPVARWQDSSGKGHHATQAVGAVPPVIKRVGGRTYPQLFAVGTSYLVSPVPAGGTKTVFLVGKFEPGAMGTQRLFNLATDANYAGNGFASIYLNNGDVLSYFRTLDNGGIVGASNWNIITLRFNGDYVIVYFNGLRWMEGFVDNISTFTALFLFASSTTTEATAGSISEVMVYDVELVDADRKTVEGYLSQKHSIALKYVSFPLLPSDAGSLTMYFEGDNIQPADMDGSTVTTWKDQSSRNCNLTQTTFAAKPTVMNAAINGHKSIYLDGTDDCMVGVDDISIGSYLGKNYTFFVVHKKAVGSQRLLSWQNQVSGDHHIYGFNGNQYLTSQTGAIDMALKDNLWQIGSVVYKTSTVGGLRVFVDGLLQGSANTDQFPGVAALQLGCYVPGSQSYKGEVAAIIVYRSALSDADRKTIEGNLGTKYGILMPAFTPSTYGFLTRWFRGESFPINNIGNGTTYVWQDESTSPVNATSPAATNYPLVNWNAHNGQPGVFFDGVDDYFTIPKSAPVDETWFLVVKPTIAGSAMVSYATIMFTETNRICARLPGDKWGTYTAGLGDAAGDIILPANTAQILCSTAKSGSPGETRLYRNGTLVLTHPKEPLGAGPTTSWWNIGADSSSFRWYQGYIMQVITYSGVLSDANRRAVFTELGKKYNIPIVNS